MERPFKCVIDYIKSLFTIPPLSNDRKRRASPLENIRESKLQRLSPYIKPTSRVIPIHIERDTEDLAPWMPRMSVKRSPISRSNNTRIPMKVLKPGVVNLVSDDDEPLPSKKTEKTFLSKSKKLKSFTSTPMQEASNRSSKINSRNDNDDVLFVNNGKTNLLEKIFDAKMEGWDYLKPKSLAEKPSFNISSRNGTPKSKNSSKSPLEYSFRLEDKMQYKKLLEQVSNNESSLYQTPMGKSFGSTMPERKSALFSADKSNGRERTKDRLVKVLDSMENEPVVVKDSDSEDSDVVLVRPPSPKPDIKVEPVNSFRKIVNSSQASSPAWLDRFMEDHRLNIEKRQQEIDELKKYSDQTAKINREIEMEVIQRKVNDCLKIKSDLSYMVPEEEAEEELPELTEEQLNMVRRAFRGDPNEVLARNFNLNITRRDLMTLAGLNWLNDEVINFYMNLIIERGKDKKWPSSYAFNTFFYTKLIKDGPQSLRRWTKRIDLFSYDFVCVPVHLGMHWCMAIIDFTEKKIKYFDSMGSPNNRCLEALRSYLEAEHLDKKDSPYNTRDWNLVNMDEIPQQMNGSDCGMFACTFAEFITRKAKITFSQDDMPYLRKKMVVEIMSGKLLVN
ncbi:sentrin-specific protease 1-like [Anthonomus grandis grandis]|uniref:sentrin-specific protease 1-like n=1 Tax=Anthonomus grandis grandis TaxID=2921223 RepID=UPI0021655E53|nr:sentrin-specific protease 1-like [Anthonomus grandis grandis]